MQQSSVRRSYRFSVRLISVVCALSVMAIYSKLSSKDGQHLLVSRDPSPNDDGEEVAVAGLPNRPGRRLFSYSPARYEAEANPTVYYLLGDDNGGDDDDDDSGGDDSDNCTAVRGHHAGYNDSCTFVKEMCSGEWVLFDYLGFILCDMRRVQVSLDVKSYRESPSLYLNMPHEQF